MTLDQFWSAVYAGYTIRAFPPFRFLLIEASFDAFCREVFAEPGIRQPVAIDGRGVTFGAHRIERHGGTADVVLLCTMGGEIAQVHELTALAEEGAGQARRARPRPCAIGEGVG